jgi:hypothetical protein
MRGTVQLSRRQKSQVAAGVSNQTATETSVKSAVHGHESQTAVIIGTCKVTSATQKTLFVRPKEHHPEYTATDTNRLHLPTGCTPEK